MSANISGQIFTCAVGVILQEDLHWTTHLVNLKKKQSHSIDLPSKIIHYAPKHLFQTMYYSFCIMNNIFLHKTILKSGDKIHYYPFKTAF